jgi:hypothetical protein
MTSRLRELIQQLGEAIHESVIESEQIAGVVQTIRESGFDVLLMLEATIGLNEVTGKEDDEGVPANESGSAASGEGSGFTKHDLHFLRCASPSRAKKTARRSTTRSKSRYLSPHL